MHRRDQSLAEQEKASMSYDTYAIYRRRQLPHKGIDETRDTGHRVQAKDRTEAHAKMETIAARYGWELSDGITYHVRRENAPHGAS